MTKANECTCPSGDGSLRHPCPAHPASVELAGVGAKLTFINGRPILMYEGCSVIEDQTAYEVIRMIKWIGELERQKPVATVAKVPGEDWNSLDFHRDLQDMQPGTKLYAAPVAQAQHSVPEGWMLVPVEQLLNMMSDKDHDTRIMAERQLLAVLAAAPGKEVGHE